MMVSKKKALEFYMREKNELIEDLTGMELYQEEDYEWAHTVSDEDITVFFASLPCSPGISSFIYAPYCPQCFKFYSQCYKCTYSCAPCRPWQGSVGSRWIKIRHILECTLTPPAHYSAIINKMVRLNKFDR